MADQRLAMRLAIRREGDFVNAYHAAPDTMDGAILLGSIREAIVRERREVFDEWKALMSRAYQSVVRDITGHTPTMHEEPAPEHERSGRA